MGYINKKTGIIICLFVCLVIYIRNAKLCYDDSRKIGITEISHAILSMKYVQLLAAYLPSALHYENVHFHIYQSNKQKKEKKKQNKQANKTIKNQTNNTNNRTILKFKRCD